jgi:ribosome-interacting GTPase 1
LAMPTNLPPEYFEAEKRYRAAQSTADKTARLEELLGTIPKHKGTDKLRAAYRRRLSKLKSAAQVGKKPARQESIYNIDREGAGQVVLVGPPNAGKSALLAALTNATPEVSEAPFSTWEPTPGMMPLENIQIQLIDTPPLNREYLEPALLDLIRRADLVLLVVDLLTDPLDQLDEAIALLQEHRIVPQRPATMVTDERGVTTVPLLVVVNKDDDEEADEVLDIFLELLEDDWPLSAVSATTPRNLDGLKQAVFDMLEIIRVYSKPPGRKPDLDTPFVLARGSTVEDLAGKVHKDFLEGLKAARVWGSATHDGLMVGRDHVLADGDIVELRV